MLNHSDVTLGDINGIPVTIAQTISLLERLSPDALIGEDRGEQVTVGDFLRRLHRLAAMPTPVPQKDRISDKEWAEAVFTRGEAPYGRCPWCQNAKSVAGCTNLCDMPAAAAQEFNDGMLAVLNKRRSETAWLEALGGCICGPPRLYGYATERDHHEGRCPMRPQNH